MMSAKPKKKSIPKVLRDLSWNKWVGEDIAKTKCLCCGINDIKMNSFHCGHIVAEANGGTLSVDNLKPICAPCNLSMGKENMDQFKLRCGFSTVVIPHTAIQPTVHIVPKRIYKSKSANNVGETILKAIDIGNTIVSGIQMLINTNELKRCQAQPYITSPSSQGIHWNHCDFCGCHYDMGVSQNEKCPCSKF